MIKKFSQRIKKIEEIIGVFELREENIKQVYNFFLTGDEKFILSELSPREVSLAAVRAKEKGLVQCPGLFRVFKALRKVKLVGDERSFFAYLGTFISPRALPLFTQNLEDDLKLLQCSKKLGIVGSLGIFIMPRPYDHKDKNRHICTDT